MTLIAFCLLSLILAWLCRRQLMNPGCHGFYRFFAFEAVLWLLLQALPVWHRTPLAWNQLLSLGLLSLALGLLITGLRQLRRQGGHSERPERSENFAFENTQALVTNGVYAYIRHPMYSSLLAFNWGLYLKQPQLAELAVAVLATLALYLTARFEERENCEFFGSSYRDYQKRSRMFLPALWQGSQGNTNKRL